MFWVFVLFRHIYIAQLLTQGRAHKIQLLTQDAQYHVLC